MFCPFCGLEIPDHASMCVHCSSLINLPPEMGEGDIARLRRRYQENFGFSKPNPDAALAKELNPDIIPALYTARLVALILDWLIICGITFLFMKRFEQVSELIPLLVPIGAFLYFTFFTTLIGRTIGKLLVGIIVIDQQRKRLPTLVQSFNRSLASILSFLFLLAGFLSPLFDLKSRTWHDHLVGTLVIYKR